MPRRSCPSAALRASALSEAMVVEEGMVGARWYYGMCPRWFLLMITQNSECCLLRWDVFSRDQKMGELEEGKKIEGGKE